MAERGGGWLVEHGIGETRALRMVQGEIIAARVKWPGELRAGNMVFAQLTAKASGARRGLAKLEDGREVLVDHLPPEVTEGVKVGVRITRAPIAERGRFKRAQGRCFMAANQPPSHAGKIDDESRPGQIFTLGDAVRGFAAGDWEEVWHAASSGRIGFEGGEILCSVTPAMTVIDIDGDLPPRELSLAAIPAIAKAIAWFEIGGNIGIDFPTIEAKADRRKIDDALGGALDGWPHERTAMNGFGLVQIIARLDGPSLLHRFAAARTGLCARYALRVAERAAGIGPVLLLRLHPALKAKLKPEWIEELARRSGRKVHIETDPALALEAPSAQILQE